MAWFALDAIFKSAGGVALPLDDSYIHFQFARSIANGTPLVYAAGAPAVAGATSLLWPAVLSVGYLLGLHGAGLAWLAWLLAFTSLALLANEARRATERLASPLFGWGAALLVLGFSGNVWFAASGMELLPLAWLLLRAVRKGAEWCEREASPEGDRPRLRELFYLAAAAPLMRPEGALAALLLAGAFVVRPGRASRWLCLPLAAGVLLPGLFNWLLTGQFASTTAQSKWLLLNPYTTPASLATALFGFADTLVTTLLNGEVWSAVFLPRGSAIVLLASLAALPLAGVLRRANARAVLLSLLALGILIPGSYDCPLCNRLRYLWPFLPAWFVGTAVGFDLLSDFVGRKRAEWRGVGLLLLGGCAGGLLGYLPFALDDLGTSAAAISEQQVSLGKWARQALPARARIGVNDTGAIAYFSDRPIFDVVGLTTAGESRYWTAGPGSRFEHYERLERSQLPSHFIVYPEWFAIPSLLGEELTDRDVPNATILGGRRMVAYTADWTLLGSSDHPAADTLQGQTVIDRLDVADLESERQHGYGLGAASQSENIVVHVGARAEGARSGRFRDDFQLKLAAGGALVLRIAADLPTRFEVSIDGRKLSAEAPPSSWHELRVELPADMPSGQRRLSVRSLDGEFTGLHYFSLATGSFSG